MKNNKRLILHIGMAKTGTSSIQNACSRNRDYLTSKGVYYPAKKGKDKMMFARIFKENPFNDNYLKITFGDKEKITSALDEARLKWSKLLENNVCQDTIISCEGLTFLDDKEIDRLKHFILGYFNEEDITVLIYVREPISFIKSMVSWAITKNGATLQQAINNHKSNNHFAYLARYEKKFKNIVLRPFMADKFYHGKLIDDFFHTSDIKIEMTESMFERKNESIGMYGVQVLSELNEKYPLFVDGVVNKNRGLNQTLLKSDYLSIFQQVPDQKFDIALNLSRKEKKKYNDVIENLNQYLDDDDKFSALGDYKDDKNIPRTLDDIPRIFFIDLINEYNKYIEKL